jgi:hypothetical protein
MSNKAHLVVLLITMLNVGFILRLVRLRQLRAKYSILWLVIGVGLVGFAASPRLLDRVSEWLGISYGPATFFLGAITLLFLVVIHFSWELSRLEERTRRLAEELALLRVDAPTENGGVGGPATAPDVPALDQGARYLPGEAQ